LPIGAQRSGVSLGYRRPTSGAGAWVIRLIVDGKRQEARLGEADDVGASPAALNYGQAVAKALDEGKRRKEAMRKSKAPVPPLTVRQAVEHYVAIRKAKDDRNGRDAEVRLAKHLLADHHRMADRSLAELNDRHWNKWRAGLSALKPASVTRVAADVKAAMNAAWRDNRRSLPADWRDNLIVGLAPSKDGASDEHAPPRNYLPDDDVRRIIATSFQVNDDFGRLVLVLAATGARLSQVRRMLVADVIDGEHPYLMVPRSRKGRPGTHAPAPIKVQAGQDVIDWLRPATVGRSGHEPLLLRWTHVQEKGDKKAGIKPFWRRDARKPWRVAADMTALWREAVRLAGISSRATPYRLRDASIIRALRQGIPLALVAHLHDTSETMIRRSYAREIDDALGHLARKGIVPIAPTPVAKLKIVGG
jgi:hypothetical protein